MTDNNAVNAPDDQGNELPGLPPLVDVIEDAVGIVLRADMPGVPKERLNVHVEGDALTIEGEVSLDMPEGMEASHVEVTLPRYRRSFTLSKELDPDRVDATFEQGVLTLRIPRAEHAMPKRVDIQVL